MASVTAGRSARHVRSVRIQQLSALTLAELARGELDAARRSSGLALSGYLVGTECLGTWRRRAGQVREAPEDLVWVTGVAVDLEQGAVVGRAGFHAAPDASGLVEVGYAVDPALRRRGYARAALTALLARAAGEPAVHVVRASVSPANDASLALVRSMSFAEVGEQWDDEDGRELVFERSAR